MRRYITLVESFLDEAPLADFGTFGDLEQEGSFRGDDLRAIRSEKWLTKVQTQFNHLRHPLNVYLYNGEGGNVQIGDATVDARSLEHLNKFSGLQPLSVVQGLIGKLPPDAENSITVILIENEGGGRVPLTPWILAHRIAHAILDGAGARRENYDEDLDRGLRSARTMFEDIIRKTIERYIDEEPYKKGFVSNSFQNSHNVAQVAKMIGTMRSARTGNLTNGGEFFVELIAQVMTQGKVTFNVPPIPDDPAYAQKLGQRIAFQAEDLTFSIKGLLEECVGKAFLL